MASRRAAAAVADMGDFVAFKDLQTTPEDIRVGDVELDMHYQRRGKINTKLYSEYAELWKDGVDLAAREPMILCRLIDDHNRLVALDAWHRVMGLVQAFGKDHVHRFEVANVTAEQAYIASYGANPAHGFARTNEDKRNITDDALMNFTNRSDTLIANWCAVSVRFVGLRRAALEVEGKIGKTDVRIGKNNKTMSTGDIGTKRPQPQPEPASVVAVNIPAPAPAPAPTNDQEKAASNGKSASAPTGGQGKPETITPLIDPTTQPNFVPATLPGGGFEQVELPGGVTIMLLNERTFSVCEGFTQIDIPAMQVYLYLKAYADKIS